MDVKAIQFAFLCLAAIWVYYFYVFVTDTNGRLFIFSLHYMGIEQYD